MNIIVCIPSSTAHYCLTEISYLYVFSLEKNQGKSYALNLVDKEPDEIPEFTEPALVFNKRLFDRFFKCESYDLETQSWLITGENFYKPEDFPFYERMRRFYHKYKTAYRYIPFLKHQEFAQALIKKALEIPHLPVISKSSQYYREKVYRNITQIESNGLHVELELFNMLFRKTYKSAIVHTFYNFHTRTGRPSNRFDGVNYSALNKTDQTRKAFTSRFENGRLIEFDFDAYHVRLIAQILNFTLPVEESIHTYFGKQYFYKDFLTEKEYQDSKGITFRLLYGGMQPGYEHINFFMKVEEFKQQLWHNFLQAGFIRIPFSERIIKKENYEELNMSKLFNYVIQAVETEYSILFIEEILTLLTGKLSKLVLYTYDALLIDFSPQDGSELFYNLINTMTYSKAKAGFNYKELQKI